MVPNCLTDSTITAPVHFIGIGGTGMSALASVLLQRGAAVSGSDSSPYVDPARFPGARVHVGGHCASALAGAKTVVYSGAVPEDNVERRAAAAAGMVQLHRSDLLAKLMHGYDTVSVSGTHGKTTVTGMLGTVFAAAQRDPCVINGGIVAAWGSNVRTGAGRDMIVEADESDGSMLRLPSSIAVVINADPEHLDYYGSETAMYQAYAQFVAGASEAAVMPDRVQPLIAGAACRRVLTFGASETADVRITDLQVYAEGSRCVLHLPERPPFTIALNVPGAHNLYNAAAVAAVAFLRGLSNDAIAAGLAQWRGAVRRFTDVGHVGGVRIIDDYAHHPVEVAAVLAAARTAVNGRGRVIAVFQPHRYTRTQALFDGFCRAFTHADTVFVTEIYAAGEAVCADLNAAGIVAGLRAAGHGDARPLHDMAQLPSAIANTTVSGDMVVCMGAGDITRAANALPQNLRALCGAA